MKKVAIIQSNYIPWKGYFHIIQDVDDFVFLDSVQYTSRDWRNRNRIKTPSGPKWLTVPVNAGRGTSIREAHIDGTGWQIKHYKTLRHNYHDCKYFDKYHDWIEDVYLKRSWQYLSQLNQYLIVAISGFLGIDTQFHDDSEYPESGDRNLRLLNIAKALEADVYVSGPAAKEYLDERMFEAEGIRVEFFEYPNYPHYPQLHGDFEHRVSILDLLFGAGDDSSQYIWGDRL